MNPLKREPNKLSCFSKGDGERAMLEASNELRVVRDELENLMDIISTKVSQQSDNFKGI